MFERPRSGERAVLVHMNLSGSDESRNLAEFRDLAASAGAQEAALVTGTRHTPDARLFVGSGKAGEIARTAREQQAELVIFDHALSPSQERNLEALLQCRVLDRTGLILDIFAQRARSHEGKLQVELAQLKHMATRLVRGWTHLERQKGGIGLRGPGETQLETDRRLLGERIRQIDRRLARVDRQRDQGRRSRRKADVPTVSLVGYTNAGKSTLFNRLTGAGVYAADKLFATLDPTLRRLELDGAVSVILADTVGFIGHLPHELVAAFRATLQETAQASLLLHVIDASDPEYREHEAQVEEVLDEIGARGIPRIRVFNKLDRITGQPRREWNADGLVHSVWVSAASGAGLDLLGRAIAARVNRAAVSGCLHLPPEAARLRARLFSLGAVIQEQQDDRGGWLLEFSLPRRTYDQLYRRERFPAQWLEVEPRSQARLGGSCQ